MQRGKRDWRAIQIPLAAIQAKSEEERCYRLSDQAVSVLLSLSEYAYWKPRWETDAPLTDMERDFIDALAAYIQSRLMDPDFCGGEGVIDVRQNEENPCLLEKSTDGGATWAVFADLHLCAPYLRRDPLRHTIESSVDGITFFTIPDGPSVPTLPETVYYTPPESPESDANDRLCNAAANAAEVLSQVYEQIGDSLVENLVESSMVVAGSIASIFRGLELLLLVSIPSDLIGLTAILGIVAVGEGYNDNPLTNEDIERLKCILLENASQTGSTVTFDFNGVYGAIDFDHPKNDWMRLLMTRLGADALNFAGAARLITDADCACGDCQAVARFTGGLDANASLPSSGAWTGAYGHNANGAVRDTMTSGSTSQFGVQIDLGEDCLIETVRFWSNVIFGSNVNFDFHVQLYGPAMENRGLHSFDYTTHDTWIENLWTVPGSTMAQFVLIYVDVDWASGIIKLADDIEVNIS